MNPHDPLSELTALATRVADSEDVDWGLEATGDLRLDETREQLHDIARIARAYRRSADAYELPVPAARAEESALGGTAPIARWGSLELLEEIGGGSFGRVYRARDTRLDREVALKWMDVGHDEAAAQRALEEGRHLARVRHENVLAVHGADIRDGKVGIWAELVRGEDLETRLGRGERWGDAELRAVGRSLCAALAALHREGLVHADLKAANVMRDSDGRILLVDLGSSLEDHSAPSDTPTTSTPLASAPEVLEGTAPTPASDLWSLGALLYRLASGKYPVQAESMAQLRRAHLDPGPAPLRDLRPDLPADLLAAIDSALSHDPAQRPHSAGAFEQSLLGRSNRVRTVSPTRRRGPRWTWVAVAVVAAVLLGAVGIWRQQQLPVAGGLALESTLFRSRAEGILPITTGAQLRVGDQLFLEVDLDQESWVYVINEDALGELTVLFPLLGLDGVNPLPPGHHRLPGAVSGQARDWQVTSSGQEEHIALIVSDRPLVPLERRLTAAPRAGSTTTPDYAQLDPQSVEGLRGVAGLAPSRLQPGAIESGVLEEIVAELSAGDEPGLRVQMYRLLGS